MNVITIDLELNQPSRKLIQLGYTINNVKNGKMLLTRKIYINPGEPIAPEITELTAIRQSTIDDIGTTLEKAYEIMCQDMERYQVSKHPIQWGLDHYELRNALGINWDDYIFRRRGIDVKALYQSYAMCKPQGKTVAGLARAMQTLGLEFQGFQHDAMDDAINTFIIFKTLTDKQIHYDEIIKVVKK